MPKDDERDYAEESYWRNYCLECDGPCRSEDGQAVLTAGAPPVHGPGSAEQMAVNAPSSDCDSTTDRGRRAVLKLESTRRAVALASALRSLPPAGTQHE